MVKCEILFDNNPQGIYYSGQKVTGKVKITLSKKRDVQAIILNLSGCAKTKWPENDDLYKWFGDKEKYFDDTKFLIGLPGAEKTLTLEPRIHSFDFSYTLPCTLPSSFEGRYANIRYLVKVTLKCPWKFDQEYVAGFTVLKPFNLNFEQPETKLPFETINSTELNSSICSVGIRLPQMGFVSGQLMPVTLNIENNSNCRIKNSQINFNQIITCKTLHDQNYMIYKKCLAKEKCGQIRGCRKYKILREIRIPPVPPTCKNSCSIITINYEIEVVVNFGWFHKKFNICVPVIIGIFPVCSVVKHQPQIEEGTSDVNSIRNDTTMDFSPKFGPMLYEACEKMNRITISEDVEHPIKKTKFLPRYPVYIFDDKTKIYMTRYSWRNFVKRS